jgi:hypothetical protein
MVGGGRGSVVDEGLWALRLPFGPRPVIVGGWARTHTHKHTNARGCDAARMHTRAPPQQRAPAGLYHPAAATAATAAAAAAEPDMRLSVGGLRAGFSFMYSFLYA